MTELQLTYLLKVAQLHSVSLAAAQLHVTQPSVSVQITRLEKELGFCIFERGRKDGLALTRSGKAFVDGVGQMQQDFRELLRRCAEQGENDPAARIGFFSDWSLSGMIAAAQRGVLAQWPEAELTLEAYPFRELVERLENNELDAILSVRTAVPVSSALEVTLVGETKAMLVYSARHPLRTPGHPTLSDFHSDTFFVLPSEECPYSTDRNQSYFLSQMMQPRIEVVPNLDTQMCRIADGGGYGVVDSISRCLQYEGLASMPLDSEITLCMAQRAGSYNPVVDQFCVEVQRYLAEHQTRI